MADPYGLLLPRLEPLRMRKAMTQLELAKAASVSPATVNRAEAGVTISMENTHKIAVTDILIEALIQNGCWF
ncbi:MAG: helix-turn-helix domain-containing protein [Ktedonobacterales bacterium]